MTVRHLYVAVVLSVVALLAPVGAGAVVAAEPATASVAGKVVLPEGVDATTVTISIARRDEATGMLLRHALASLTAEGTYAFPGLTAGEYRLFVRQPAGTIANGATRVVTLVDGEERTGVDFDVPLGAALSGTVAAPAGIDLRHLSVSIHVVGPGGAVGDARATADVTSDGTWSLTQQFPGTYRISVAHRDDATWPAFLGGSGLANARNMVVTAGGAVAGLDLTVKRSGALVGRVDLSSIPEEESRRCVTVTVYAPGVKGGWVRAKEAKVAEDGSYAVRGLHTGSYRLGFADSCVVFGPRVTAATQFYPDALAVDVAASLKVSDGADRVVPSFKLAPAGHLAGSLYVSELGAKSPASGRLVTLYRKDSQGALHLAETRTDKTGSYRFDFIPAGEYVVGFARGDKRLREVYHPSALTLAKARTVTVPVGPRYDPLSLGTTVTWRRDAKVVMTYAPYVYGKARVGRALRIDHASYAQGAEVTVRHQWQLRRHGKVRNITGATAKRLALKPRHAGARVRLRIIATARGHERHVHRTKWSAPVRR
ncbi:hypothetical protein [Nocardioides jishulii]|uniref:Alpha-amylase n=1 Tax=Nocardioides jishulii TaxID=2575440 RepID=A0A4U2YRA6_9ACTN|nr:hypothetical protein [Nocardioides jishulii]QCX26298.1 hypothetical protein FCL41_01130 [Nocardioides jishulii]TKI63898.1 hypothetical protein FC770_01575 [Nocardioides jishulii]